VKPISPNPSLNRHIRNKDSASGKLKLTPSGSITPDSEKRASGRGGGRQSAVGIPPEHQSTVSKVIHRLNELAGTNFPDHSSGALSKLVARLNEARTEAECLEIVNGQYAIWQGNKTMMHFFRPSTLFDEAHFDEYLQSARSKPGRTAGGFVG
jgi:uncharacterized phage protein (TIGR02220 family)